jgi:hypothetical protein
VSVLILGAKAGLAVMLLVAAGAKAADLTSFAATARLFLPLPFLRRSSMVIARAVAVTEFSVGIASLAIPAAVWVNAVVLTLACGFLAVYIAGYALYRGRSCQCFGALSQRRFDATGVARSVVVTAAAGLVAFATQNTARLSVPDAVLLALGGALVTIAAHTAARVLRSIRLAKPDELAVIA